MRLFILRDASDGTPLDILPTKKEAKVRARDFDGGETEIEAVDLDATRAGICHFIRQRFGTEIFEN